MQFSQSRVSKVEKFVIVFFLTTFSPLLSIHSKEYAQLYVYTTHSCGVHSYRSYTVRSYRRTVPASVCIVFIPHVSFPSLVPLGSHLHCCSRCFHLTLRSVLRAAS